MYYGLVKMTSETELKRMVARILELGKLLLEAEKHNPVTGKQPKQVEDKPAREINGGHGTSVTQIDGSPQKRVK
jgi:hypothetical protein